MISAFGLAVAGTMIFVIAFLRYRFIEGLIIDNALQADSDGLAGPSFLLPDVYLII